MSDKQETVIQASPKSSPSKKDIDIVTKAINHLAQGKRNLLVNDIQSAVSSLQEAARLLGERYGETAPECGDAYFYYGRALLELARIENGVIGNALDGVPDGDDLENSQVENPDLLTDKERDIVCDQVDEALEENFNEIEKKTGQENTNGDATDGCLLSKGAKDELPKSKVENSNSDTKEEVESNEMEICESVPKEDSKVVEEESDEKAMEENLEKKEPEDEKKEVSKIKEKEDNGKEKSPQKEVVETKTVEVNGKDHEEKQKDDEGSTEEESPEEDASDEGETPEGEEESQEGEAATSQEEGEKTDEEEDVTNLQLAWEMLELAKVIFEKQVDDKPEFFLKVAQVHLKLGEVSLENENYPQGIEDLKHCLKIQMDKLSPDDRCIAETHYQLGVAHSFSDDFDSAIASFQAASDVIDNKITNLKKKIKEKESWTEAQKKKEAEEKIDPFYTEEREIEELEKLLPEMKEKLVDMNQMKKDSKERLTKAKETAFATIIGGASSSSSSDNPFGASTSKSFDESISSAPVSNISHLMKKKRKSEDEINKDNPKKSKGENGEVISTNGKKENGIQSPEKMETDKEKEICTKKPLESIPETEQTTTS